MNISGIRPSTDFYNYASISGGYNNYNLIEDDTLAVESEDKIESLSPYTKQEDVSAMQTFDAYDYANLYDSSASYPMKGADSEIKNLDVVRAISDMEKDSAISQYQYFVGDTNRESTVVGMEDFSL